MNDVVAYHWIRLSYANANPLAVDAKESAPSTQHGPQPNREHW
jgi:hypothetical protein